MTHWRRWPAALLAALLVGCASLPAPEGRVATTALQDVDGTRLGRAVAGEVAAHPGVSGIHALSDPRDAFAARVLLAAAAEKTLDVQYYIWHADASGTLLLEALWQAAERGVRVRLLLDDANTGGMDAALAALDAHPNIELRLYNPLRLRHARLLNFMTEFSRLNRRMHNKAFIADNRAAIVGGRNVGDEYFGAGGDVVFADLDVIALGAVVPEISQAFDLYWNSASAYPAATFVGAATPADEAALKAGFAGLRSDPTAVAYAEQVRRTPALRELLAGTLALQWAPTHLVYDDPAKTLDTTARTDVLLFPELVKAIGVPETSFDLVSPYFVPGEEGTAALAALAGRGVRVRVLTNSLASSDVGAVHAGYAKRRVALLRAGVELYELKPGTGNDAAPGGKSGFGSSASTGLHAKTFAVDGRRIFIGSFNFDPRSALLNTELGVVIGSPLLAQQLAGAFDTVVPRVAYQVRLAADGQGLVWIERTADGERQIDTEPETGWLRRAQIGILSTLPIDWLL